MYYHIYRLRKFCGYEISRLEIGKVSSILTFDDVYLKVIDYRLTGYATPQNLQVYALYLDSRIRAYKEIKHDAIKVQAESNRDLRTSASIEEDGYSSRKDRSTKPPATSLPTRSKTIMGRKLRSMKVEKGLLRETKVVHGMIDALVECRVCSQWFIYFCACNLLGRLLSSFTWTI
jgi:hypothetical protein